jgi:hypothetical protein
MSLHTPSRRTSRLTRTVRLTTIALVFGAAASCSRGEDVDDTSELGGSASATPDSARLVAGGVTDSSGTDTNTVASPAPETGLAAGGAAKQASQEADEAVIERLEAEARALAKRTGCQGVTQCRSAPLGAKPCGGPRDYLVYCALTTDSTKLYRKLAELEKAERAYNAKNQMMSTCEMLLAPKLEASGGQCRAVAGNAVRPQ